LKKLPTPELAIVITGPSGGGKTRLAEQMASQLDLPVQVMDSMKVYRGMDIGSAKPAASTLGGNPFCLVDLVDPWQEFTVFDWLEALSGSVSEAPSWLISGGTAFYLHALREGIFAGPGADPVIRQRLAEEIEQGGLDQLHQRLQEVDPEAAQSIHPHDRKRIVRALEVYETSQEPISVWHRRRQPILDPDRTLLLGVSRPREEIHKRIEARVLSMFESGWVDEVKTLLDAHDPPWSSTAGQSIGYQLIADALHQKRDPRQEVEKIQAQTRSLARSQLVWARKLPIEWFTPQEQQQALLRAAGVMESVRRGDPIEPDSIRIERREEL